MRRTPTTRATTVLAIAALCIGAAVLGSSLVEGAPAASGSGANSTYSAAALPVAGKVRPPAKGALIGLYKFNLPWDVEALSRYSTESSRKQPAIAMWYQQWGVKTSDSYSADKFLTSQVKAVLARGTVPLITWEPWNPTKYGYTAAQSAYQLSDINAGRHDAYIRSWARAIKAVGGPVMLRPMHEMNGYWYPWGGPVNGNSPAQFRAAWRRIHGIFRQEGATNVTWVWSPNARSSPNTYANRIGAYYPGDTYVDWIGISGFNWGTSRSFTRWQEFEEVYTSVLTTLKVYGKPIVLAEMASVESGGNKAMWIKHAYATLRWRHPEVKAVVYYDKGEDNQPDGSTQDWQITSSSRSARAYRRAVGDKYYLAGPVPALSAWQSASAP